MQKVLEETQLDMNEFDNLLQPIIDTCTKDAISVSTLELSRYLGCCGLSITLILRLSG